MALRSANRALLLALTCTLAFAAGCGDAGPGDDSTGTSEDALDANELPAFQFFIGKGLTNFQAAGIVGNLVQESNVIPTAVQSGGPGRGIAQWSTGGRWDHDANDNAVAYASKMKESVWSLNLQLEFIWYELSNFSGYGLARLKATTNVAAATVAFQDDFEGCGTCEQSTRISYANAALAAYGQIPYAASYVAQSFPLATTTLKMKAGQVIPSSITMKNSGTKNWDANTKLGTTDARERQSAFADSTWLSPTRLDAVTGTVAPGATFKFQFDLKAPTKLGMYDEHFGLVEEGVAWFGDKGQGGPADTNIEVKIEVVAADDTSDGGVDDTDGGGGAVVGEDGGLIAPNGGDGTTDPNGSPSTGGDDGSNADTPGSDGCSASPNGSPSNGAFLVLAALGLIAVRRRKNETA